MATKKSVHLAERVLNSVMTFLLRSPFHGLVSKQVMLITFQGKKSGNCYTTPVSYVREGCEVTAFTPGKWHRNLAGGAPVILRIQGNDMDGMAETQDGALPGVAVRLQYFLSHIRGDAKYHHVRFDTDGTPNLEDCQRAAQKLTMIRIQVFES